MSCTLNSLKSLYRGLHRGKGLGSQLLKGQLCRYYVDSAIGVIKGYTRSLILGYVAVIH